MKFRLPVVCLLFPLVLGGCAIPDLVAHGIKVHERNQEQRSQRGEMPQSAAPSARSQQIPTEAEAEVQTQYVPPPSAPSAVSVEPLR